MEHERKLDTTQTSSNTNNSNSSLSNNANNTNNNERKYSLISANAYDQDEMLTNSNNQTSSNFTCVIDRNRLLKNGAVDAQGRNRHQGRIVVDHIVAPQ